MKKQIIFFILIFLFIFYGCSRQTDWTQFRGEKGWGASSASISPPFGIRWKIKLQNSIEKINALNPPVVVGNTIYFGSEDGNFYALDAESGYMRWVFRSGAEINSIPCVDKNNVYFGSKDGKLYALSLKSGKELWNFATESQINSQVEYHKDHIIFAGDADAIYFLSPDGIEQFRIDNPGWYNFTFNITDDVMYFATGSQVRFVGPFDINRREFLWWLPFNEIDSSWYSFAAVRKNMVYFGTSDGYTMGFYAFNSKTGAKIWEQHHEAIFDNWYWDERDQWAFFLRNTEMLDFLAPTIWKDYIIYSGGDNLVRAFDAKTGELRWKQTFELPVGSSSTIAGNRLYFGLFGNAMSPSQLVCLEALNGKLLWSMETEGSLLSSPVIAGKRIIFGTDKNIFYVLEEVF